MQLNFPNYTIKTKIQQDKTYLFDCIRKKYVLAQPEEWVRQHLIHFLIKDRHFPKALIAVEKGLVMNGMKKRSDVVVFDRKGRPVLLVECKSPSVKITQRTFEQIALYNQTLRVKYLLITNGLQHYCCCLNYENNSYEYLADIPFYEQL